MPNPIERKRLKKKMIDRWENEGGRIAPDTTTSNDAGATSKDKGQGKKVSSRSDDPTVGASASPTKRPKPARK